MGAGKRVGGDRHELAVPSVFQSWTPLEPSLAEKYSVPLTFGETIGRDQDSVVGFAGKAES
jgi:hypothetical protein